MNGTSSRDSIDRVRLQQNYLPPTSLWPANELIWDWREFHEELQKRKEQRKEQLELLKILWGHLDTIIELMQTVRVYITLILDTVSSGFSEFPNSMRPPCTTMPWTIWPALVLLLGVCWMFDNPSITADELQYKLSLEGAK